MPPVVAMKKAHNLADAPDHIPRSRVLIVEIEYVAPNDPLYLFVDDTR